MRLKIYLTAFKKMKHCKKLSLLKNLKLYFSIFSFSQGLTMMGIPYYILQIKRFFPGFIFYICFHLRAFCNNIYEKSMSFIFYTF